MGNAISDAISWSPAKEADDRLRPLPRAEGIESIIIVRYGKYRDAEPFQREK